MGNVGTLPTSCVSQWVVMHFPTSKEDFTSGVTNWVQTVFAVYIILIDVLSDVFRRVQSVIIVIRRHGIIINLCVSAFWTIFRISRIMDFRILIYSDYHLFWLFCALTCHYVYY